MLSQSVPQSNRVSPLARPFALARLLAGFLTAESVKPFEPTIAELPANTQDLIRTRIGRGASLTAMEGAGKPQFDSVNSPSIMALLQDLSGGIQAAPNNLTGFQWVEIGKIIT